VERHFTGVNFLARGYESDVGEGVGYYEEEKGKGVLLVDKQVRGWQVGL
jgi:hypothetical protein